MADDSFGRTRHLIVYADSRDMNEVADSSVHLVITSPPYWQLKDYGDPAQIGFHDSYEEYINNLNLVWMECFRALHSGCRLCINIGDQFARSAYYGRYKVIPIRTEIIRFCETLGLDYMGAIIWQKVTTTNTTGGASIMGSFPYPRNGILKLNYEFILIFRKRGKPPRPVKRNRDASKLTTEEWNTYFTGHWKIPGSRQKDHLAKFPDEIPNRLIRMFSFVGDTVLDPFLGSGTTSAIASQLDRSSIGYEINTEYEQLIHERLVGHKDQPDFLSDSNAADMVHRIRPVESPNIESKFARLPYRFRDPVALNKKLETKQRHYGSRIDSSDPGKTPAYRVNRIVSPECLELEGIGEILLAGVLERTGFRAEAMEFLRTMISEKYVLLRWEEEFDKAKPACYIYLRNRTNINARLIKSGLVDVDLDSSYQMKRRFIRYAKETFGDSISRNRRE